MRGIKRHATTFVAGVAGVVVGSVMLGGVVYAANGGSLLIGKANKATAPTSLTNSAGVALALAAKAGYPALKVNTAVKVTNLNADKLDSLDSTSFLRKSGTAQNSAALGNKPEASFALASAQAGRVTSSTAIPVDIEPPDGVVDFYVALATCPAGTVLTGGGGLALGAGDLFFSGPTGEPGVWEVASVTDPLEAYAVCLNLRGAPPAPLTPLRLTSQSTSSPAGPDLTKKVLK